MKQRGFTLIELVVVIVILGILAATALPKFIDLSDEARQAAVEGVAAAATSGFAINYGARKASAPGSTAINAAVCTSGVVGSVMTGGLPTDYTVSGAGDCAALNDGDTGSCTLTDIADNTKTATISFICAKP